MLRRRGTYTVNAETGIRNGHAKAQELTTVVNKIFGRLSIIETQDLTIAKSTLNRYKL